jgi:hypothetical protein
VSAGAPTVHIAITAGDKRPFVCTTAVSTVETEQLAEWLEEHPELEDIWRRAWNLTAKPLSTPLNDASPGPDSPSSPKAGVSGRHARE